MPRKDGYKYVVSIPPDLAGELIAIQELHNSKSIMQISRNDIILQAIANYLPILRAEIEQQVD